MALLLNSQTETSHSITQNDGYVFAIFSPNNKQAFEHHLIQCQFTHQASFYLAITSSNQEYSSPSSPWKWKHSKGTSGSSLTGFLHGKILSPNPQVPPLSLSLTNVGWTVWAGAVQDPGKKWTGSDDTDHFVPFAGSSAFFIALRASTKLLNCSLPIFVGHWASAQSQLLSPQVWAVNGGSLNKAIEGT